MIVTVEQLAHLAKGMKIKRTRDRKPRKHEQAGASVAVHVPKEKSRMRAEVLSVDRDPNSGLWVMTLRRDRRPQRETIHLLTPAGRPAGSELGYTTRRDKAMRHEPEPVDTHRLNPSWREDAELRHAEDGDRKERARRLARNARAA